MINNPYLNIGTEASTGCIILDRPKALNALSLDMCDALATALRAWADDPAIDRVIISATPGRAFCAGGDVRAIAPDIRADIAAGDAYFLTEYQLDLLIHLFPKPVVVVANGLTMGGGAGVLLNASHPVITTAMDFAMPETAIGLFPDVGASIFLRKAPPAVAAFLGMTGWRIGAGDMAHYGIAPRVIDADSHDALIRAVINTPDTGGIDAVLDGFRCEVDEKPLVDEEEWITRHFSKPDPVSIRAGLEGDDHPMAEKTRHALDTRCPLSIAVAHRLLTDPQMEPATIVDAIRQDYALALRMIRHPDFVEGVRALLIDKDNAPAWQPASLSGVRRAMVEAIVTPEDAPVLAIPEASVSTKGKT